MQFAYERIVTLPLDLAIVYSLEQNFRLDVQRGIISGFDRWELEKDSYHREALELLREQGCNYYPGHNDEPWIHVKSEKTPTISTLLSRNLIEVVNFVCGQAGQGLTPEVKMPPADQAIDPSFIIKSFMQVKRCHNQIRLAGLS